MERYLVGLVGSGIGASLSPALHEHEADALGMRYLYRQLDLDVLGLPATAVGEVLAAARLLGYDGLNVTHPCKRLVVGHVDELSPEAAALGAVNTVVVGRGGTIGHNTDSSGFEKSLGRGLPDAALDDVVLLGAGGAGAAVAHALSSLGAGVVHVYDVDRDNSEALAASVEARFGTGRATVGDLGSGTGELAARMARADGIVHATPTGMTGRPGTAVPATLLRPELWVADVVYRPLDTELVRAARTTGCRVLDGGAMAVFQAAEAFELFTGVRPDLERMLRHFRTLVPALGGHDARVP